MADNPNINDSLQELGSEPELLTRRQLFTSLPKAAVLGGAVAAVIGASAAVSGCGEEGEDASIDVLEVASEDVTTLDSFTEVEDPASCFEVTEVATLPAGAMPSSSDGVVASIVGAGEGSNPLTILQLMDLGTGELYPGLEQAVGHDEGFTIYEARCSASLVMWVESNFITGDWRVYSAPVTSETHIISHEEFVEREITMYDEEEDDMVTKVVQIPIEVEETKTDIVMGTPTQLDEGDVEYDAPEIAVIDAQSYWIVQPAEGGNRTTEDSYLKANGGVLYTSHGRFCGTLSVFDKTLIAMPRADSSNGVYYQMTAFQGGSIVARQILPHGYRPNTCTYLNGTFSFGIRGSYDYGDGLANVGTYISVGDGTWLRLIRTPLTPPGLCNGWIFCKSNSRTVFVDLAHRRYFTVSAPGHCENYGDYSVQLGNVASVVNYAVINKVADNTSTRSVLIRRINLVAVG